MRLLDISYPDPEQNLALDEVLIEAVAAGTAPDTLRFWECPMRFVVIGSSQRVRAETQHFNCLRDQVPILRRCSAGGAVLQGPGCLNFTLAVSYATFPETASLHTSYAFILDKVAAALASLGLPAERRGISDLAVGGMKCSGNAQRRKRDAFLHHGTLLYQVDTDALGRYLQEPADQPEYRKGRSHDAFVRAVTATPEDLRAALLRQFCPGAGPGDLSQEETLAVTRLAREKYANHTWNFRR